MRLHHFFQSLWRRKFDAIPPSTLMKTAGHFERHLIQSESCISFKPNQQELNGDWLQKHPGLEHLTPEEAQTAVDSLHSLAVILYELFTLSLESNSPSHEQHGSAEEVCQAA